MKKQSKTRDNIVFSFPESKIKDLKSDDINLITDPFLLCSVDNFLCNELYNELYHTFPQSDFLLQNVDPINYNEGNKVKLDGRSEILLEFFEKNPAWRRFSDSINSQLTSDYFRDLFDSYIPKRKNFKDRKWIIDKDYYKNNKGIEETENANYVRFSFEFSYMENGSFIAPHTDSEKKVISMLFYFADPNIDWEHYDCGTYFYKTDKIDTEFNLWESIHLKDDSLKKFRQESYAFHYSEFKANKFVLFIKTDNSWHEVKKMTLPSGIKRKTFIVNLFHS